MWLFTKTKFFENASPHIMRETKQPQIFSACHKYAKPSESGFKWWNKMHSVSFSSASPSCLRTFPRQTCGPTWGPASRGLSPLHGAAGWAPAPGGRGSAAGCEGKDAKAPPEIHLLRVDQKAETQRKVYANEHCIQQQISSIFVWTPLAGLMPADEKVHTSLLNPPKTLFILADNILSCKEKNVFLD